MKVIAMYLPQFHRVKENDEWWGEGFTEWSSVKLAKPLFEGHNQPVVPYKENYYDLTEKATMQWQADLMKQYGVDGVCIYHYWFKDGRKILEKPAENLLQWKDIDMPFCFCWANETWARTWSAGADVNVWASTLEKEKRLKSSSVLLDQKYGWENDWKEHFDYLLPFFKDERYIKVDGKPVIVLYKTAQMACLENMIDMWKELAKKSGLKGLYLIAREGKPSTRKIVDAIYVHEPSAATQGCEVQWNGVNYANYDEIWRRILDENKKQPFTVMGFSRYDDSPRHGKRGLVIGGASSKKFKEYFSELLAKNEASGTEFTFLNAWNEWGEGMYLEPDAKSQCQYLECIQYAKENYHKWLPKYKELNLRSGGTTSDAQGREKHLCSLLDKWLSLKEKGISLSSVLKEKEIKQVAMYGYGLLGRHFYEELLGTSVSVKYIIDRDKNVMANMGIPVYSPQEDLGEVDAVIVTATYAYGDIYPLLKEKGIKRIISLEHLIVENS